ncbi:MULTISPECIES: LysR family transcriptional regulator [Streptomyces]|uniref:LysR family transcriptional regulator n=1 Tax=Streptomyces TaxID=1883 RepID=UPI00140E064C|nr:MULTISPECIES: LysR family transcriptional regulator [Streptomyces]MDH6226088.1 DNA-binding transcriptional LysR family regulator [Streptomyces sp. MJP52]
MDLALLRTFVAVHRAGSFTRAAALLGLSQPAVTSQIRTLERQLGRPLFLRRARGVVPTTIGEELAHKAAPHLDALVEIAGAGLDEDAFRTLHLAGPPELVAERLLPALTGLDGGGGPPPSLRASFGNDEDVLEGLAAGHYDLAVTTARPRGALLDSTPLCDEEHVLVAAPGLAAAAGTAGASPSGSGSPGTAGGPGGAASPSPEEIRTRLDRLPVVEVHESLPFVSRYWSSVFDARPAAASGAVVVPDLRAVLACAVRGAGLAVLPRYLCAPALRQGAVVPLHEPDVPPLRTYFLVVRTGTLGLPHIGRAHERLRRAASAWS